MIICNNFRFTICRIVAKRVESSYKPFTQFLLTSYYTMIHLPKLRNEHWYITVNYTPHFILISPVFLPMSFFCSRIQSRNHLAFCHASLVSSGLWQLLSLSLLPMSLTVLRRTGQAFCRACLSVSDVFSWLDWGHGVLVRIPQRRSTLLNAAYKRA